MSGSDRPSVGPVEAARAALAAREGGRAVAIVLRTGEDAPPRRMLVYSATDSRGSFGAPAIDVAARALGAEVLETGGTARRALTVEGEAIELLAEAHQPPERLVIVGAGHIAVPLAELGALLGFRVLVLDDREAFATADRFPDAAEVRRVAFPDAFAGLAIGRRDHVVLVTRAHRYDFDCLSALVSGGASPRYIGMVGSRRRVRAAFTALAEAGIPRERLAAVHAPIGVDIGAETPEEIAVSVAAELVAVRRGVRAGGSLRDRERVVERLLGAAGE